MTDYISREAALKALVELIKDKDEIFPTDLTSAIQALPAADVREVVYCKDCVHSQAWYADKRICRLWNEEYGNSVFNDGYCNYGAKTYADALNCGAKMEEQT